MLTDQALRELADVCVAQMGDAWHAVVHIVSEPDGAFVLSVHRDPTSTTEGHEPFFIDRSDGLRVTPGSSDWQRAGYVLHQWGVVDLPGAKLFVSSASAWDAADPAWRTAWIHAWLKGAHERYSALKVVFPAKALPEAQLDVAVPRDEPEPRSARESFGPFAPVFEPDDPNAPSYRSLLHLSDDADAVFDRLRDAVAAPDAPRFVKALFEGPHWWLGFVAGAAYLWDRDGRFDRRWLWQAIDGGNWATPQLVAIAFLTDTHFVRRARRRIVEGSVVRFPDLINLDPYEIKPLGGEPERSGKLLASILGVAPMSPGLKGDDAVWRAEPRFADLLEEDAKYDRSDHIASSWLESVVGLFARRGIAIAPAELSPRSVASSFFGIAEHWAWKVRRAVTPPLVALTVGFALATPPSRTAAQASTPPPAQSAAPQATSQNPSPMAEGTRAHERLVQKKLDGATRSFAGPAGKPVELFVPDRVRAREPIDLVVHFHGAAWIPEQSVAAAGIPAVTAVLNLGTGSGIYDRSFADPGVFDSLLAGVTREVSVVTGKPARVGQVTLVGFSAGHGAVRAILREPRHFARVSAVLLLDGMHTSYVPEGKVIADGGTLDTTNLAAFAAFARAAMRGEKRFLVTHSEIFPGTFASTTETADWLVAALGLRRAPVLRWGPRGMQQLSEARAGRFALLGFAGNSAPDHVDQFHAMPELLARLLKR